MKNEINRRWLAAFLSVLFLLTAYKCSSQVLRYRTDTSVVIAAASVMKFSHTKHDTDYVSIYADSSAAGYKVIMAVSYPDYCNIEACSISIGHQFGANESFTPNRFDCNTNTAEFLLTAAQLEFLKASPFTVIGFHDKYEDGYCPVVKTKRYFMQFLTEYKK
jgi:hypothetical protein